MAFDEEHAFGDSTGGADTGGPNIGSVLPPNVRTPASATNVVMEVLQAGLIGSFRASWDDEDRALAGQTVMVWHVRFCPEKAAGRDDGTKEWINSLLFKSKYIASFTSNGRGERYSYVHVEAGIPDGYALVIGVNTTYNLAGDPAGITLLRLTSTSAAIPSDISDPSILFLGETIDGFDYYNVTPTYTVPSDTGTFKGVELYFTNYVGISDPQEMGNLCHFLGTAGGVVETSTARRYPAGDALGTGTFSTTSGSPSVVRVTGTAFDAGWVGRTILVKYSGALWTTTTVAAFTDVDNMDLTDNAPSTGTVSFFVVPAMTVYFVSVSGFGTRKADITTSPSVSL